MINFWSTIAAFILGMYLGIFLTAIICVGNVDQRGSVTMHDMFYFTDVHGEYNLFQYIIKWCKKQDPECMIIYGGDAADRGPEGYRIIQELLNDPKILYIYGNHEDLFVKAADAIIGAYANNDERYEFLHTCNHDRAKLILREMSARDNEDVKLHLYNGGEPTLLSWLEDGANEEIIDKIRNLPRTFSYENIDFCHAGSSYSAFEAVAKAEYNGEAYPWYDEEMVIWDRGCIPLGWKTDRICVHGHTITLELPRRVYGQNKDLKNIHPCAWHDLMGAKNKRGGIKIDMDTGIVFSGRAFVLNCLTMKVTGFEDIAVRNSGVPHYINMIGEYKII